MLLFLQSFCRFLLHILRGRSSCLSLRDGIRCGIPLCFCTGKKSPVTVKLGRMRLQAPDAATARHLVAEIFFDGIYRAALASQRPLIIDCGANCGFASAFFKHLDPDARIMAIEPSPASLALLRRNAQINQWTDFEIIEAACAARDGDTALIESDYSSLMSSCSEGRAAGNAVTVPAKRLSGMIEPLPRVDLVKMDIEGAEHDVLDELIASGAVAKIDRLTVEYHHRFGGSQSRLSTFLGLLENSDFTYGIVAKDGPGLRDQGAFQDIMIYAHRVRGRQDDRLSREAGRTS